MSDIAPDSSVLANVVVIGRLLRVCGPLANVTAAIRTSNKLDSLIPHLLEVFPSCFPDCFETRNAHGKKAGLCVAALSQRDRQVRRSSDSLKAEIDLASRGASLGHGVCARCSPHRNRCLGRCTPSNLELIQLKGTIAHHCC